MNSFLLINILNFLSNAISYLEGVRFALNAFSYGSGFNLQNSTSEPMKTRNRLLNNVSAADLNIQLILNDLGNFNTWNIETYKNNLNNLLNLIFQDLQYLQDISQYQIG